MKKANATQVISNILSFIAIVISIIALLFTTSPRYNFFSNDIYKKAEDGDFESQMFLGQNYYDVGRYEESYYWFSRAAFQEEENVDIAWAALGFILGSGKINDSANLISNREKTKLYYDKAITFAQPENEKQITINYLLFLLSNEKPKVEYDENGEQLSTNSDDFIRENIDLIKSLLNKLYDLDCQISEYIEFLGFPINDSEYLYQYIVNKRIMLKRWEYDYTKYDYNGSLSFTKDNEKLMLVDSWSEIIDNGFSTVMVYKYYHYNSTQQEITVNGLENVFTEKFIQFQ